MAATIIEALREYLLGCPLLGDNRLNVDYLPDRGVAYTIDTTPATEIIKRYTDGSSMRQYLFVIASVNDYGPDVLQNLANSGLYEQLANWLEAQTAAGNLPLLPTGMEAQSIEAQSTGYLFGGGADTGRYQIQCRLKYLQRKG